MDRDELKQLRAAAGGTWEYDSAAGYIRSAGERQYVVAEVRGWGHLTGRGGLGLGLSDEDAAATQDAWGRLLAAAPALAEEVERLQAERDKLRAVLRDIAEAAEGTVTGDIARKALAGGRR